MNLLYNSPSKTIDNFLDSGIIASIKVVPVRNRADQHKIGVKCVRRRVLSVLTMLSSAHREG